MSTLCYVNFHGNAREAISYYQRIFKGPEPEIMSYGDYVDPNYQTPEHIKHLVMHAEIIVFGSRIMISDTPEGFGMDLIKGNNFSLAIVSNDIEKLKDAWHQLKVDAKVITEFSPSFFSEGYGYLIDKFDTPWQLIFEK
jgi:PhnB protein